MTRFWALLSTPWLACGLACSSEDAGAQHPSQSVQCLAQPGPGARLVELRPQQRDQRVARTVSGWVNSCQIGQQRETLGLVENGTHGSAVFRRERQPAEHAQLDHEEGTVQVRG